jgi:hypothetical protein
MVIQNFDPVRALMTGMYISVLSEKFVYSMNINVTIHYTMNHKLADYDFGLVQGCEILLIYI